MKLDLIERAIKTDRYKGSTYKICNCEYCCDGMKKFPNINLYFEHTENTDNPIEDECYEYDLGVMLADSITTYDSWDYDNIGWTSTYYYKMNYCPICGEKIEVNVIGYEDVSDEYNALVKEREEIHNKWRKTDSIKEKYELEQNRRQLDNLIESYYHTDNLPDREEDDDDDY